jgi:hypothetical protein
MLPAGGPRHWYRALIRFMLKVEISMALALVLGAFGCAKPHGTVLGKSPKGEPVSILAIRAGDTPPQVTISGVMLEKCPVAGCWLKVQDQSGTIMVDTKSAGFVVVNVPLESKVTVAGKIVTEGDEVLIEASGLRY